MMTNTADTRCGFVAVVGAPNAGKSTFVNEVVGTKVSIVTHKVQTTRNQVRGIAMQDQTQIIFVDTPGIFKPKKRFDRAMVASAWSGAEDADVVMLIVDARKGLTQDVEEILAGLAENKRPKFLVLNKIDLLAREDLLALTAAFNATAQFQQIFMVSALKGDGVEDVLKHLAAELPEGPWHYPEDEISDAPMRFLAEEITREKIFINLHEELPYAIVVKTESWQEQKNGSVRIEQVVYVQRDSQKGIVLGKGGARMRTIGQSAREELERILETRVHLFIYVKVDERMWDRPENYASIGLDFDA
jgi:GTP-binding protein Era